MRRPKMSVAGQALTEAALVLLFTFPIITALMTFFYTQWTRTLCAVNTFRDARIRLSQEGSLKILGRNRVLVEMNEGPFLTFHSSCHGPSLFGKETQINDKVSILRLEAWNP